MSVNDKFSSRIKDDDDSPSDRICPSVSYCEVVIVGSGVAGLECANTLTSTTVGNRKDSCFPVLSTKDILILEARDRVGGRVHTRKFQVPRKQHRVSKKGNNEEEKEDRMNDILLIDDGAAWVHGVDPIPWPSDTDTGSGDIPSSIPFYQVNDEQKLVNPVLEHLDRNKDLNEVAGPANPWTRPFILHKTQSIAFYLEPQTTNRPKDLPQKPLVYLQSATNSQDERNNFLIQSSIRRHFEILRRVNDQVNDMYDNGMGIEANTTVSLMSALEHWNGAVPVTKVEKEEEYLVLSLTNFYQHMLTCWQGLGFRDIPVGQFGGYESESDDDDPLLDDEEFEQDGDFGGFHCTVKDGMQKVVQGLLTPELERCIRLNTEVVRIQRLQKNGQNTSPCEEGYNVQVEAKDGSKVYARGCVVTIPVGCLRENHSSLFRDTTPLSPEKLEAFQNLTMAKYKKVFLTFDSIFWPHETAFLGLTLQPDTSKSNPLGTCLFIDNLWANGGHACMEAILTGDQAQWATCRPDSEIRDTVLEFMARAMNLVPKELLGKCVDCHVTRWEEDPFSRGCYSALSLGGMQKHIDAMREPEWDGSLRFAGDVCSIEFEGSVSAAIFSGRYVGRGLLEYFGKDLNASESTASTEEMKTSNSNVNYEDYDWKELPSRVQKAAELLGYNKRLWNRNLEPPSADLDWDDLSREEQRCASIIGFNRETWNAA